MDDLNVQVMVLIDNVWHYVKPTKKICITQTPEGLEFEIVGKEVDMWRDVGER